MKKILLSFLLAGFFVPAFAQHNIGDVVYDDGEDFRLYSIPSFFCNNNKTKLCILKQDGAGNHVTIDLLNDDFEVERQISYINIVNVGFTDLNNGSGDVVDMLVTQNLFNNDDEYEYFTINGNLFNLMSGNNVIYTLSGPENYDVKSYCIMLYNEQYYLGMQWYSYDESMGHAVFHTKIYRINRSSVTSVLEPIDVELPFNIMPSVASRSQNITIQFGENTNASEVSIMESDGRVVKRIGVTAGQTEITIPASDLGTGVKVVGATNGSKMSTRKIVVH